MKSLGYFFVFCLIVIVGLHGYMKMEYNTMDACDAALLRIKSDSEGKGLFGKGKSLLIKGKEMFLGSKTVAADLEKDLGLMGCYRIAVMGMDIKEEKPSKK